MGKTIIWQIVPYLLPVISYMLGKTRNSIRVPERVSRLLTDRRVIDIVVRGVEAAATMGDKTDEQKREYVRAWAKSELYRLLGEWLPDSAVNYVIEHVIVRRKD